MKRNEFRSLAAKRPVMLDGSTGSELVKRGLPAGACPEKWVLENPEAIRDLHRCYAAAGSDIVLACTFGANRIKLADHRLGHAVREMNVELVRISREAAGSASLFGDLSPTGRLVEPFGDLPFEEAVDVYRQQAAALLEGGVDGFMIETMLDIQEARAALLAVVETAPDLTVFVSMTYDKDGKTITGTTPAAAMVTLQALGASAVGSNCSTGPAEMLSLALQALPFARVPVLAKPNAGAPEVVDGKVRYSLSVGDFADALAGFAVKGVRVMGGCCGTGPDHIIQAVAKVRSLSPVPALPDLHKTRPAVSSARSAVAFSSEEFPDPPLTVIGERINPTGKKAFQKELLAGNLASVRRFADEQREAGADLLDVNLGLGGLAEPDAMRQAIAMLAASLPTPLCIDTVNPDAMEAALRLYPGRALVNSVSGEKNRIEKILPIAARYGAMLIALPVGEGFIPGSPFERMEVVKQIMHEVVKTGLSASDVLVDALAMTVSSDSQAARNSLEFINQLSREMGLRSVIGLSNISFGLPERSLVNAAFLSMCMAAGLEAVIANPSNAALMAAKSASEALLAKQDGVASFVEKYAAAAPGNRPVAAAADDPAAKAGQAVLKGEYRQAEALVKEALAAGVKAEALVAGHLVPSIMKAGELFEKKEYYLPQLMLAGEAMRRALEVAEPALIAERAGQATEQKGSIVIATVKGDVHDIGKNLVALMLRNHGFSVTDLGKDVASADIIEAARERKADIVGLSALMTTTLEAMRETITALRAAGTGVKVMVGGAAVTESYAREIGADGFGPDAVSAVKLAEHLLAARASGQGGFYASVRE